MTKPTTTRPSSARCAYCDTKFRVRRDGPLPTYCSGNCRAAASYRRQKADGRYRAMLDRQVAERAAARPKCVGCQATLKRSTAEYCSAPQCRRVANAARERERYAANKEALRQRIYAARAARTPEQVDADKKTARLRRVAVGYSESKRAVDARRRARKRGAAVEKFTNGEIFDRDGWRCGICGKRINRRLSYPHPLSVSLDHLIPLSLGGEHSRANVRAAHLTCNVQRGAAREGADQLALL